MIIIDKALERREQEGHPIRVGMIGAGFMARGIALQILNSIRGMDLVAISNRQIEGARRAYAEAGAENVVVANDLAEVEKAIGQGRHVITEDPFLLCHATQIDAIIEVTGTVEF